MSDCRSIEVRESHKNLISTAVNHAKKNCDRKSGGESAKLCQREWKFAILDFQTSNTNLSKSNCSRKWLFNMKRSGRVSNVNREWKRHHLIIYFFINWSSSGCHERSSIIFLLYAEWPARENPRIYRNFIIVNNEIKRNDIDRTQKISEDELAQFTPRSIRSSFFLGHAERLFWINSKWN